MLSAGLPPSAPGCVVVPQPARAAGCAGPPCGRVARTGALRGYVAPVGARVARQTLSLAAPLRCICPVESHGAGLAVRAHPVWKPSQRAGSVARLGNVGSSGTGLARRTVHHVVGLRTGAHAELVLSRFAVSAPSARALHGVGSPGSINALPGSHVLARVARRAWHTVVGVRGKGVPLAPRSHVRPMGAPCIAPGAPVTVEDGGPVAPLGDVVAFRAGPTVYAHACVWRRRGHERGFAIRGRVAAHAHVLACRAHGARRADVVRGVERSTRARPRLVRPNLARWACPARCLVDA